ncbi:Chemotaxis protein methyltransferase CheR [hydrothermal vent metagenome]|uniref:protein-glutamate O-methyltransferase n=1 Tax=hydrothermal vent metagenome TaxID=652676 RepID=A0A3B0XXD8_9ZZZZ
MASLLPTQDMHPGAQAAGSAETGNLVFSIADEDFFRIRDYLQQHVGIQLTLAKKQMVASRLARRLRHYSLSSYGDYFRQVIDGTLANERQVMLDMLTTNETYLFREPAHFEFLREGILAGWKRGRPFRAWSAACSSGEEAYSMAMVVADRLGESPWEIFGSDISTRVLATARAGHYPMERISYIPRAYLQKYCRKGVRAQHGTLLVDKRIRQRLQFQHINLNAPLPEEIGQFDVIFLRNVLIYFDAPTRQEIVKRLLSCLRPGGHFFISHTETIAGVSRQLETAAPSVYRKK